MVRAKVFGVGLAVLLLTATALAQKPGWPKELVIAEYERAYVTELIRWADGNLSRAARKAGMDRMNLYRVLQRHGLREQLDTKD